VRAANRPFTEGTIESVASTKLGCWRRSRTDFSTVRNRVDAERKWSDVLRRRTRQAFVLRAWFHRVSPWVSPVAGCTSSCNVSSRRQATASVVLIPSLHAEFTVHRELRPATALETVGHTTRKVTPMIRRMHTISTSRCAAALSAVALAALLAACSQSAPTAAAEPTVSPDAHPDLPEIVITASRTHNAPARPDPKSARVRSRATDKSS
jgi:hypothetical protein